jgi:hypothetical protein
MPVLLAACPANGYCKEGSMNSARRTAGALSHQIYGAWRRACLRQAGQLSCNPLGIIVAIAVMVATVEIWSHSRDAGLWVVLLAAPAVMALATLAIVRLLQPMTVVSSGRRRNGQPAGQSQPVRAPQARSEPSLPPAAHDPGADEIAGAPARNDIIALLPDSARRLEEPGRIQEPV